MKFRTLVLEFRRKSFVIHTQSDTQRDKQTDRHFSEIVKSCSGHPKTWKSIKSWKSKIFMKSIFSFVHIEESNDLQSGKYYMYLTYFYFH